MLHISVMWLSEVLLLALDMYGGVVGMRYYLVVGIYPWCVYNHKRKTQHLFNVRKFKT